MSSEKTIRRKSSEVRGIKSEFSYAASVGSSEKVRYVVAFPFDFGKIDYRFSDTLEFMKHEVETRGALRDDFVFMRLNTEINWASNEMRIELIGDRHGADYEFNERTEGMIKAIAQETNHRLGIKELLRPDETI